VKGWKSEPVLKGRIQCLSSPRSKCRSCSVGVKGERTEMDRSTASEMSPVRRRMVRQYGSHLERMGA
jgi:hypothetical protein